MERAQYDRLGSNGKEKSPRMRIFSRRVGNRRITEGENGSDVKIDIRGSGFSSDSDNSDGEGTGLLSGRGRRRHTPHRQAIQNIAELTEAKQLNEIVGQVNAAAQGYNKAIQERGYQPLDIREIIASIEKYLQTDSGADSPFIIEAYQYITNGTGELSSDDRQLAIAMRLRAILQCCQIISGNSDQILKLNQRVQQQLCIIAGRYRRAQSLEEAKRHPRDKQFIKQMLKQRARGLMRQPKSRATTAIKLPQLLEAELKALPAQLHQLRQFQHQVDYYHQQLQTGSVDYAAVRQLSDALHRYITRAYEDGPGGLRYDLICLFCGTETLSTIPALSGEDSQAKQDREAKEHLQQKQQVIKFFQTNTRVLQETITKFDEVIKILIPQLKGMALDRNSPLQMVEFSKYQERLSGYITSLREAHQVASSFIKKQGLRRIKDFSPIKPATSETEYSDDEKRPEATDASLDSPTSPKSPLMLEEMPEELVIARPRQAMRIPALPGDGQSVINAVVLPNKLPTHREKQHVKPIIHQPLEEFKGTLPDTKVHPSEAARLRGQSKRWFGLAILWGVGGLAAYYLGLGRYLDNLATETKYSDLRNDIDTDFNQLLYKIFYALIYVFVEIFLVKQWTDIKGRAHTEGVEEKRYEDRATAGNNAEIKAEEKRLIELEVRKVRTERLRHIELVPVDAKSAHSEFQVGGAKKFALRHVLKLIPEPSIIDAVTNPIHIVDPDTGYYSFIKQFDITDNAWVVSTLLDIPNVLANSIDQGPYGVAHYIAWLSQTGLYVRITDPDMNEFLQAWCGMPFRLNIDTEISPPRRSPARAEAHLETKSKFDSSKVLGSNPLARMLGAKQFGSLPHIPEFMEPQQARVKMDDGFDCVELSIAEIATRQWVDILWNEVPCDRIHASEYLELRQQLLITLVTDNDFLRQTAGLSIKSTEPSQFPLGPYLNPSALAQLLQIAVQADLGQDCETLKSLDFGYLKDICYALISGGYSDLVDQLTPKLMRSQQHRWQAEVNQGLCINMGCRHSLVGMFSKAVASSPEPTPAVRGVEEDTAKLMVI